MLRAWTVGLLWLIGVSAPVRGRRLARVGAARHASDRGARGVTHHRPARRRRCPPHPGRRRRRRSRWACPAVHTARCNELFQHVPCPVRRRRRRQVPIPARSARPMRAGGLVCGRRQRRRRRADRGRGDGIRRSTAESADRHRDSGWPLPRRRRGARRRQACRARRSCGRYVLRVGVRSNRVLVGRIRPVTRRPT